MKLGDCSWPVDLAQSIHEPRSSRGCRSPGQAEVQRHRYSGV